MREQQFNGEVVMVNAAAGAGIGASVVEALLARGARVMATDMSAGRIWNDKFARAVAGDYIDADRGYSPLGRPGTPEEVAQLVLLLSSSASVHISGEVIRVAC